MGLLASNKVTQRNMALPSLPASGLHLKDLLELCLKTAVIVSYLFHAVICHFSERSVSGWTQGQDPKLCKHGGNSCSGNLLDQVSADTCSTLATGKGLQDSSTECLPPCTAVCNHQHSFLLVRASRYFQSPFLTSLVILLSCPCVCVGGDDLLLHSQECSLKEFFSPENNTITKKPGWEHSHVVSRKQCLWRLWARELRMNSYTFHRLIYGKRSKQSERADIYSKECFPGHRPTSCRAN